MLEDNERWENVQFNGCRLIEEMKTERLRMEGQFGKVWSEGGKEAVECESKEGGRHMSEEVWKENDSKDGVSCFFRFLRKESTSPGEDANELGMDTDARFFGYQKPRVSLVDPSSEIFLLDPKTSYVTSDTCCVNPRPTQNTLQRSSSFWNDAKSQIMSEDKIDNFPTKPSLSNLKTVTMYTKNEPCSKLKSKIGKPEKYFRKNLKKVQKKCSREVCESDLEQVLPLALERNDFEDFENSTEENTFLEKLTKKPFQSEFKCNFRPYLTDSLETLDEDLPQKCVRYKGKKDKYSEQSQEETLKLSTKRTPRKNRDLSLSDFLDESCLRKHNEKKVKRKVEKLTKKNAEGLERSSLNGNLYHEELSETDLYDRKNDLFGSISKSTKFDVLNDYNDSLLSFKCLRYGISDEDLEEDDSENVFEDSFRNSSKLDIQAFIKEKEMRSKSKSYQEKKITPNNLSKESLNRFIYKTQNMNLKSDGDSSLASFDCFENDKHDNYIFQTLLNMNNTDHNLAQSHLKEIHLAQSKLTENNESKSSLVSFNCSERVSSRENDEQRNTLVNIQNIDNKKNKNMQQLLETFSKKLYKVAIKNEVKPLIKHIAKKMIKDIIGKETRKRNRSLNLECVKSLNKASLQNNKTLSPKDLRGENMMDDILIVDSTFSEHTHVDDSADPGLKNICHNCRGTFLNLKKTSPEYINSFSSIIHSLEENIIYRKPSIRHCATETSPIPFPEKNEEITKRISGFLNCISGESEDLYCKEKDFISKERVKHTPPSIFRRIFSRNKSKSKDSQRKDIPAYFTTPSQLNKSSSLKSGLQQNMNLSNHSSPGSILQDQQRNTKNERLGMDDANKRVPASDLVCRVSSCQETIQKFKKSYFPKLSTKNEQNVKGLSQVNGQCTELTRNSGAVFIID